MKVALQEQEKEDILRDFSSRTLMSERSRRILEKQRQGGFITVESKSENRMNAKSFSMSNLKMKNQSEKLQTQKRVSLRKLTSAEKMS